VNTEASRINKPSESKIKSDDEGHSNIQKSERQKKTRDDFPASKSSVKTQFTKNLKNPSEEKAF
jgi:hypothetical protein